MTDTTTRTRPDSTSDEWLEYAAELGRRNKENAEKMRGLLESVTRDNGEIGRISERIRETSAQIQTLKDEEEQISGEIDEYYREIKVSISDLEDSYFQELDQAKGKVRELGETADRYRSEVEAKLGEPTPKGSTMLPKKLRRTLMGEAADSLMDVLMREKGYFTHADLWPAILEKVRAENPGTRFYNEKQDSPQGPRLGYLSPTDCSDERRSTRKIGTSLSTNLFVAPGRLPHNQPVHHHDVRSFFIKKSRLLTPTL